MLKNILRKLKNKKIIVLAVLLVLVLNFLVLYNTFSEKRSSTVWDGSIADHFSGGTGNVNDPYVIANGSELAYFFTLINGDNYLEYFNKYYVLDNNMDLDGKDFSFAKSNKSFSGHLDGQGYSIYNFKLSKNYFDKNDDSYNYSLFDNLSGATIENINFKDVTIEAGNGMKIKDIVEENATIDDNETIEDNTTLIDNNETEVNETKTNETIDDNSTVVEKNETIEDNSTVIETNETEINETKEDNSTKVEETKPVKENKTEEDNSTKEEPSKDNVTGNEENATSEPTAYLNNYKVRRLSNETEVEEEIEEKIKVNVSLFKNVDNSYIKNININNIKITSILNDNYEVESSLLVLNDKEYNNLINININGKSSIEDTAQIIYNYKDAKIKTILYTNYNLDLIKDYDEKDEFYKYSIVDEKAIFADNSPLNTIISLLNENSDIEWTFDNGMFRLINTGIDMDAVKISSIRTRSGVPNSHASGTENGIAYVNNYTADYNYYMGMNYTYSSDGTLPSKVNKNIYNDSNLVYVELHYFGTDVDGDYTGYVSDTERENQFVYYVVSPVVEILGEDVVKIELIDNPFADRPTDKVFNGWVTKDSDSLIKLDTDTYTRYIVIPVTYDSNNKPEAISVEIYASWTREHRINANGSFSTNNLSNLDSYGVHLINEENIEVESLSGLYILSGSVSSGDRYPRGYYTETGQYVNSNIRCQQATCNYFSTAPSTYNASYEYYKLQNGVMTPYAPVVTITVDYVVNLGKSVAGYYRKVADNKVPRGGNYSDYYYSYSGTNSSNTHPKFYSREDSICNTTGGCSVTNNTIYEMIPYYDQYGNPNVAESGGEYYYLATRDTNIVRLTANTTSVWGSSYNMPFTFTGLYNHTSHNYYWSLSGNKAVAYSDVRIEHMRTDSANSGSNLVSNNTSPSYNNNGAFFGAYKNVKIGRGITQNNSNRASMNSVAGGNSSTNADTGTTPIKYRMIVESGIYNSSSITTLTNASGTMYVQATAIYGCDYDRIKGTNNKLLFRYCSSGSFAGTVRSGSSDKTVPMLTTIVKSGTFGSTKYDFTTGIYLGGQGGGKHYNLRKGIIEGGIIFNLIGGPLSDETEKYYNDTYIYIKGGTIDVVVGGAGRTATYGNRIIQMTGGKVNYAIFGGSNGVTGEDGGTQTATLYGETYLYIGKNAEVGDSTLVSNNTNETVSKVEAGSIFGAGNGNSSNDELGSVFNSTIIVDEDALIRRNVYGGGNYGSVGYVSDDPPQQTTIKILGGTINGSVYGAANNNGAGGVTRQQVDRVTNVSSSNRPNYEAQGYECVSSGGWFSTTYTCTKYEDVEQQCNISIEMANGTVGGSVYGGSRQKGRVYGNTAVSIIGGTVSTDVYGGGEGGYQSASNYGTFVSGNVSVTIGDTSASTTPTISGSVYGGSAYGTVNASSTGQTDSTKSVTVTLNKGNVVNDIYGGAKGSAQYTPYVSGNISVVTNGGTANNVYGGCDQAGKPAGTSTVTLNGGTFNNVFGGGNATSIDYTNVYQRGATVGTIYGGSNQSGDVLITNVNIESGSTTTVYGGNNVGGTCGTGKVTVKGGTVSSAIYGGGNQVYTTETDVRIQNITNTVPAVYGGGNSAGVGTTSVKLLSVNGANNINITDIYGGSNLTGNVTTSQVEINHGNVGTVYGANNSGGSVATTNVVVNNGTITTVYGGGNAAEADNTNVTIANGSITNVYGGGKGLAATVNDDTTVLFNGGTISQDIFGGGNLGAVLGDTNITINRTQVTTSVRNVYGGGNQADVSGNTTVTLNNGTITQTLFGGGNEGDVGGNTTLNINNGTVNLVYGGGNQADVTGGTTINMSGGTIATNLFGGGNAGTVGANTSITFSGGSADTVYGGGNQAAVNGNTTLLVNGGSVSTALYGGGNAGAVVGTTSITVNHSPNKIPVIYGGGKSAGASSTSINLNVVNGNNDIEVGSIYGGSNQSGDINSTSIVVNTGITDYIYGGNNAGGTVGDTNIQFVDGTVGTIFGGGNAAEVDSTNIVISNGTIGTIYGGCNEAITNEDTYVTINGGTINQAVYGGGNQGAVLGDTHIVLVSNTGAIPVVFGGGNQAGADNTYINLNVSAVGGTTVTNLYGGSNSAGNITSTNITKNSGTVTNLYGGNNAGGTVDTTNVTINGGNVTGNLFGGGNAAPVGDSNVTLTSGTVNSVYGGGNYAQVTGDTTVKVTGGIVQHNVYGGGCLGAVLGDTDVLVNGGSVTGSVYAGGDGSTAAVEGNTKVRIGDSSVIGSASCQLRSACSVFGGGNAAKTGTELGNDSQAIVEIAGGTIYGNVYGGANTSKVCGETSVNIGADVTTTEEFTKAPIHIYGTVFGGGEANASGSDFYDWTFISVTNGIDVNINGDNYTMDIDGSIFGSGNASTTTGVSTITIKNFGTYNNPKKCISIQRTNLLTINNSSIALSGAADRTNDYSDVLFSFSLIDELDLMNNSTLYLETGTNILKKFKSLTATGAVAAVTIDSENKTVTKNVDNRLYVISGKNINIAKNANITDYGEVIGMTFFGMYRYNGNGTVNQGIYDKHNFDDHLDWSGMFTMGSYVLGLHKTNHDIEVDGFYTNVMDEENEANIIEYIEPTPPASAEYMWLVGKKVINYEVDLVASKYSTLGTYELSLRDFTLPNTSFEILSFDSSALASGIQLTDKNTIPRVTPDETLADTMMGLTMETSNTGWLVNGYTEFRNDTDQDVNGTVNYIGGNNTLTPSLLFCLHHVKNIATAGDMGSVTIQLLAVTQLDDLNKQIERLAITINLQRVLYTTADYEGAMTAGRKYELFTSTATNITSSASISTYFALFHSGDSVYRPGYYRALISNYVLPLGTKITMIDLSGNNVDYYYHVINATDVSNAQQQLQNQGDVQYLLSMFEVMGAQNSGVYYDDAVKNLEYYDSTLETSDEEFIFILDFDDCVINSDQLGCSLLIEMLDSDGETVNTVLGPQQNNLVYNIYANRDAVIDIDGELSRNKIYSGESVTMDVTVDYTQSQINGVVVYDTHLFDQKLGIKISIINSNNEVVSGTSLLGLYYSIGETRYYPNIDGTTRIKVADRVDSVEKWIVLNTSTSKLATGNYKVRIESFGSPDGIYYGLNSSDVVELNLEIVNEIYGLDASVDAQEMIIHADTGLNAKETNQLKYTFRYNSGLTNPSINVRMYRRDYQTETTSEYHLVDAANYFSNSFTDLGLTGEYRIIGSPVDYCTYTFTTKEDLITGTYKLEFILYDGTSAIGSIEKYIIIK